MKLRGCALGAGGPRFKSGRPDQLLSGSTKNFLFSGGNYYHLPYYGEFLMKLLPMFVGILLLLGVTMAHGQGKFEKDVIKTKAGDLEITFIGHGTLMFTFGGKVIHVDPVGQYADYDKLPQADLILITHEHRDHLDPNAVAMLRQPDTQIVLNRAAAGQVQRGVVLKNGEGKTVAGFQIEAVAAYNLAHKRESGEPFHPKGRDNGYVITFGEKRVYVAGDTEYTPEMKALKNIDIAFLPMNLPYTMTPEMVADAAKAFKPRILYPYHYGKTDTAKLVDLLKDRKEIEVRIRKME